MLGKINDENIYVLDSNVTIANIVKAYQEAKELKCRGFVAKTANGIYGYDEKAKTHYPLVHESHQVLVEVIIPETTPSAYTYNPEAITEEEVVVEEIAPSVVEEVIAKEEANEIVESETENQQCCECEETKIDYEEQYEILKENFDGLAKQLEYLREVCHETEKQFSSLFKVFSRLIQLNDELIIAIIETACEYDPILAEIYDKAKRD